MKSLFLFTNHFPYSYQENFLEDEIKYLAPKFDTIHIISFESDHTNIRKLPSNCVVHGNLSFASSRLIYILHGFFSFKSVKFLTREFFRNNVYKSKKRFKAWVSSARYINNLLHNKELKHILSLMHSEDVAYFYWGIGQNMLSLFLKDKVHLVSRFHGEWDLWEHLYGGFHSLRTEISKNLDKAVFISQSGERFFKTKYPYCETIFSPLGSLDYGEGPQKPDDGVLRVISCSTVYPLKRVPLIFDALAASKYCDIEWTHIGAGPQFEELKQRVASAGASHLKVNLLGNLSHDEVMAYYRQHHFDIFINLSTCEGVPVSIMEAMSFNIPVIATDVGSTSEEVVPEVGVLVSANPEVAEISAAIYKVMNSVYSPREFWRTHYNADVNYSNFAEMISNI